MSPVSGTWPVVMDHNYLIHLHNIEAQSRKWPVARPKIRLGISGSRATTFAIMSDGLTGIPKVTSLNTFSEHSDVPTIGLFSCRGQRILRFPRHRLTTTDS
jgi:hypothetical protein